MPAVFFEDEIVKATKSLEIKGAHVVQVPTPVGFGFVKPGDTDQSVRKDSGKSRFDLIDWEFIRLTADVLAFGANKYSPNSWRKGMAFTRTIASLFRHMIAYAMGQDNDPESGLPHLGHIGCNLMFLAAWTRDKKELDDRVKVML